MSTTWTMDDDLATQTSMINTTSWINYNDSFYTSCEDIFNPPTIVLIFVSFCYGVVALLAVIGNFLVIWIVATTRRMQNMTYLFIANLAFSDVIIGLFVIPFQFQAAVHQRWNLPYFMCAFCPFVRKLSVNVSVFTLTAIAIDRHRAVVKPLSASPSKLKTKIITVVIWLTAAALATPIAFALRVNIITEELENGRKCEKPFCDDKNMSPRAMVTYRILLALFQYVIPLVIISVLYARVACTLWGSKAPGNAQDSRDAAFMKNKKKVIKVLIIVTSFFALFWLPLQLYTVLQYIYPKINMYRYINIIWFGCDWLAMSNSCCNPFIYGIYNEKFKRELQLRWKRFRPDPLSTNPPNNSTDFDKTLTTRMSIRSVWRRTGSSGYPSFYRNVSVRNHQKYPSTATASL